MARRKQNEIPKNDFAAEDDLDICGFTTEPIATGECISSFSFDDDSIDENKIDVTNNTENPSNVDTSSNITCDTVNFPIGPNNKQTLNSPATSNNKSTSNIKDKFNNTTISSNQTTSNKNNTLEDNRKSPVNNGFPVAVSAFHSKG